MHEDLTRVLPRIPFLYYSLNYIYHWVVSGAFACGCLLRLYGNLNWASIAAVGQTLTTTTRPRTNDNIISKLLK